MRFKLVENINGELKNEPAMDVLDEEVLNEAIQPSYRDMLFALIGLLTNNETLKNLISNESTRKSLEFHHIDGEYIRTKTGRKKAANNSPYNIAIVTKAAHKHITKLNREFADTKIQNFNSTLDNEDYYDSIFPLGSCLPELVAKTLEKEVKIVNETTGIGLEKFADIKEGDVIEASVEREVAR